MPTWWWSGAGYAGLSTALELKARGVDVVVLEREHAGAGGRTRATSRTAKGSNTSSSCGASGLERARVIVGFYDEGVRYVERKLAEHAIDCD